jgi:hypothetical protein
LLCAPYEVRVVWTTEAVFDRPVEDAVFTVHVCSSGTRYVLRLTVVRW